MHSLTSFFKIKLKYFCGTQHAANCQKFNMPLVLSSKALKFFISLVYRNLTSYDSFASFCAIFSLFVGLWHCLTCHTHTHTHILCMVVAKTFTNEWGYFWLCFYGLQIPLMAPVCFCLFQLKRSAFASELWGGELHLTSA